MDTGVLPVGRFPNVAKRSSCELGSLGSYFFLLSCIWITREIIATMTMQKVSNSSHVTIIVPPFNRGQKKHHPRKNRGEPSTGVLPAAPETAYHKIRQIARKTPVRVVRKHHIQQNAPAAQILRRRGVLLLFLTVIRPSNVGFSVQHWGHSICPIVFYGAQYPFDRKVKLLPLSEV